MKRPNVVLPWVVVLLAISIPYVLAVWIGGRNYVFVGFLLNPIDSASYLAKMYEGWAGAWQFTLPYTAAQGHGSYLFLFYLFLGHLARWSGLSLILVYHLARVIGAALLLLVILKLIERLFREQPDLHRMAFWLVVAGSGMGWLVIFLGIVPTDFWVAEAYPFLSMFSNPHFPIGLALVLASFTLLIDAPTVGRYVLLLLFGLLISIILPFGLVVALVVGGVWLVWTWFAEHRLTLLPYICLGAFGGPFLLYQFWISQTDPLLAVWNAQNLTISPPLWDFILSFSPALLLAPFGIYDLLHTKGGAAQRMMISWLAAGLVLIYFPFSLQRRFMLGFYIPSAVIAVYGIDYLRRCWPQWSRRVTRLFLVLSFPTNLLLIIIGLMGALGHSPLLYLSQDEAHALAWIQSATPAQSLVLASPEMGRFIPAMTGRRVIYGHPFETVQADQAEKQVMAIFSGSGKITPALEQVKPAVNYVMYGPREQALGGNLDFSNLPVVFHSETVQIYAVGQRP